MVRSVPMQKQLPLPLQGSTGEICEDGGKVKPLLLILPLLAPMTLMEKKKMPTMMPKSRLPLMIILQI
uniref:Uncharacterized protein n=1 Tax=Arundo donax TaxID=35708 RepID=A0A0A9FL82_ARUDO